jgi:hypothetical protein
MWLLSAMKRNERWPSPMRSERWVRGFQVAALATALGLGTAHAHGQPPGAAEPPQPAAPPAPNADEPPKPPARGPTEPAVLPPPTRLEDAQPEMLKAAPGVAVWQKSAFPAPARLEWHGSMETDVGFARYTFDTPSENPSSFYDFRGRFVLGPAFRYDFSGDYFFRTTGQFVAWIREQVGLYQINVDDVYAQVGKSELWDFMVGRFLTWRVYRKGLGYDLYTLEDTGALLLGNIEGGNFGPHIYEVDHIFMRRTPGRAAFHLYPSSWSGIEVVGEYGKEGTSNTGGGRAAANITYDFLSLSAGAEYRFLRPAQEAASLQADGVTKIECKRCGVTERWGFGGGAVLRYKPIEAGFNATLAKQLVYSQKDGTPDKNGNGQTMSFGGYLELDVGSPTFARPLIVGAGAHRTEILTEVEEFKRHVQGVAYIAYPLGFNNAMVKFVLSQSDVLWEEPSGDMFILRNSKMVAGRIRVSFNF